MSDKLTVDINSLLASFSETAEEAKLHVEEMIFLISNGLVPEKEKVNVFQCDITALEKCYNAILDAVRQVLTEGEMPNDLSVGSLVKTSTRKIEKYLEKKVFACLVLQKFVSVKSNIEAYASALEPFRKKAEQLITEIDKGNYEIIDGNATIENANLFLSALSSDDYESDAGMELLDRLSEVYPSRVQIGLARKQYYLDNCETKPSEEPDLEETNAIQEGINSKEQMNSEVSEEQVDESALLSMSPVNNASNGDFPLDEKKDISSEKQSEEIIPEQKEEEKPIITKADDLTFAEIIPEESNKRSDVILNSLNKTKKSTPSATAFKKDIMKYPQEALTIIPLLTNFGVLSEKQVFMFGICKDCFTEDDVAFMSIKECLATLCTKGMLSSFSLDGETVYCLGSYCSGCVKKETIQQTKLFNVCLGKYMIVADDTISEYTLRDVVQYNNLLLEYMYGIKEELSKKDYSAVKSSITMKNGNYHVLVLTDEQRINCVLYHPEHTVDARNLLVVGNTTGLEKANATKVYYYINGKITTKPDTVEVDISEDAEENVDVIRREPETDPLPIINENTDHVVVSDDNPTTFDIANEKSSEPVAVEKSDDVLLQMIDSASAPNDGDFIRLAQAIANGNLYDNGYISNVVRATLFSVAGAMSGKCPETEALSKKLLLATNLLDNGGHYSSEIITGATTDCDDECLILAIYLQALLVPSKAYDYVLYQQAETYFKNFEMYFPSLQDVKALYNKLLSVHNVIASGFSASVMSLLGDATERRKYIETLQRKARNLLTLPNIKTRIKSLPIFYNNCFGNGSELYDCMTIVGENKTDDVEWVKEVLMQYCDEHSEGLVISEVKTEAILDQEWNKANPKDHFILSFDARPRALKQFYSRLDIMKSWVEHVGDTYNEKLDIKRINVLKQEIIELARNANKHLDASSVPNISILRYALQYISQYLTDPEKTNLVYREFLHSGVFTINSDGIPILDSAMGNIKYYEPWRNVLRHIVSSSTTAEIARSKIVDEVGSALFDNLNQLKMLQYVKTGVMQDISETQIKEAKIAAEDRTKRFKENLELAYTYNRVTEPEKERLATIMEQYRPWFFETMDFGCWSQFLNALEREIDELTTERQIALRHELNARKSALGHDESSTILKEAEQLLEHDRNFAVTEEYFNRFDNGERDFSDDLYAILHEEDSFSAFLSDAKFKSLQQECDHNIGKTLKSFAWNYLEKRIPKDWTSRQRESSRKLVDSWPLRKDVSTTADSIKTLFIELGFSVKGCVKGAEKKEEFFKLQIEAEAKSKADYRHPISIFGTQMKSPLNVIVLYGNYAPKQLVDTITAMDFGGMTVVLIDRPIDRGARRQIGEIFHTQTSGQNPFILIDQILIMYLAMHQVTERLPILLKCSLPYTTYQPFVRDGGSITDEMFCGRSKELQTIIDPNGACVVYGGRQLGKTALLQRAESRCSNPVNKEYAVYCNIINCNSEKLLVEKIIADLTRKTNLSFVASNTIDRLCKQIDKMFRNGRVKSMLLLLDEADTFLAAIAEKKYMPLQPLIDLKRETTNRFKFVLAGLHNVCRAKNATTENGVFGQLGAPLCVKPLSPTDALQLLSRPLKYLGFEIDRYPHLETILTNTNYYPGILQFFGYNLVEALNTQYSRYYRAVDGNPPFTLQDEQLGAVMNDGDLNRSIKDKFRWSLELDPRYFMLARCITVLYYLRDETTENRLGFSVDDIQEISNEYSIHCMENADKTDYINLLDEMVEMGILSKPAAGLYRLRRNSFVNIIGSDFDTLVADIISNNAEV